jgi:membrane-associated phospholipid phosphatase
MMRSGARLRGSAPAIAGWRRLAGPCLVLALAAPATARADDHALAHFAITVPGVALAGLWEFRFKDDLESASCRWCQPNRWDADLRNELHWQHTALADRLSNRSFGLTALLSIGSAFLVPDLATATRANDAMRIADSVVVGELFVGVTQLAVARQRPFAHFGSDADQAAPDANSSFVSTHAASAFALVSAAIVVARERHSPTEPYLWTIGLATAATTAYFRMAADRHYLLDVLAGAAVGIASGIAVPWLERHVSGSIFSF